MADAKQDLKSHSRYYPPYHFFALPVLLAHAAMQTWRLVEVWSGEQLWAALVAWALAIGMFTARVMALRVQDRVIRLEETLRMQRVLPASMQGAIATLTPGQFVALRFAPDAELPDLVRRTTAGEFAKPADIKKAVTNWRPDFLRA